MTAAVMKPIASLVALALLLACAPTQTPAPAPMLEVGQLSASQARVTLTPAPVAARWEVRPSSECGDVDGPPTASGPWPVRAPVLDLPARPGDLVTVWTLVDGLTVKVADCPL